MQTQLEKAADRLFNEDGLRVKNLKLYPGSSRDLTSEQMAEQINKALEQIQSGDYELVESFDD